jgi:DNA-binding NarL/FixJ family response regulator
MDNRPQVVASPAASSQPFLTARQWCALAASLSLSPRESQVAQLIVTGLSEKEISITLGISHRTVHAHVERLYRRVGVHSLAELVLRIFRAFVQCHEFRNVVVARQP